VTLPEPRFVVRSVTGCAIRADASGSGQKSRPLPTSYYVQDRWYCWRTVAAFDAPERGGYPAGGEERRRQAEASAAELNAGAL
jgi:hypothetical protein